MFPVGLFGWDERAELRRLVGTHAEALVFLYCTVSQVGKKTNFLFYFFTPTMALGSLRIIKNIPSKQCFNFFSDKWLPHAKYTSCPPCTHTPSPVHYCPHRII
jgi:hypothetical protein